MDQRALGPGPLSTSVIGLGCNNFGMKLDREASIAVVRAALDAGVTHFDTAEMYGGGQSEEHLGAALGPRRDEVVVATKYLPRPANERYEPGALARRIREGCETSLRRLGTDRIDLYYQHYPDTEAPLDEALEALEALVDSGKVRAIGSSNVTADLVRRMGPRVAATQIEWNLLTRAVEDEIVPATRDVGISVIPYFPLASGLLTGKYRRGEDFPAGSRLESMPYFASIATDENLARVERLRAFADSCGHTLLELAVAWLLAQPTVASVICGATSPAQVTTNAAASSWRLGPDELAEIDRCLAPHDA
jgi:aryl-alcohol dehydrogenase-like predicted oxidoreductase